MTGPPRTLITVPPVNASTSTVMSEMFRSLRIGLLLRMFSITWMSAFWRRLLSELFSTLMSHASTSTSAATAAATSAASAAAPPRLPAASQAVWVTAVEPMFTSAAAAVAGAKAMIPSARMSPENRFFMISGSPYFFLSLAVFYAPPRPEQVHRLVAPAMWVVGQNRGLLELTFRARGTEGALRPTMA